MKKTNRQEFIRKLIFGGAYMACAGSFLFNPGRTILNCFGAARTATPLAAGSNLLSTLKEAMFYSSLANNRVKCELCPHQCEIPDGGSGLCRVRQNFSGRLYSMVYGRPCTFDTGPIEKAPLYHFIPGHSRLCVATVGCNLRCKYCQNWQISQTGPGQLREHEMTPGQIVGEALRLGVRSISFTYTEPTVFYEYMYDISRMAKREGLLVSIVSNGYINPAPLRELLPYVDAVKIDLKAFSDEFYREVVSGRLEPVLRTLKVLGEEDCCFEIVNLVVPTLNDDTAGIKSMCDWIYNELGDNVPLHFSRFFPVYRLANLSSTPVRTLERAAETAKGSGLKYVYIGNVPGHRYNSTYCPGCESKLIHRSHFSVLSNSIVRAGCSSCGYQIHGLWE